MVVDMKSWLNEVEVDVPDMIRSAGYQVEVHEAVTEDGYILQLHRVPPRGGVGGVPVYLQHGLICSSASWVTSGENSLAFVLSEAGYDVWLGNFRGNVYGRRHLSLNPDLDNNFWRFTIHEHANYDLPAGLRTCSKVTGEGKIIYIGHSMGTTAFLAMCSTNKSVAEKVLLAVLLAPVIDPSTMRSPIKHLARLSTLVRRGFQSLGSEEFLPHWPLIKNLISCPWLQSVTTIMLRQKIDPAAFKMIEMVRKTSIINHQTSIHTLLHYAQMINQKSFAAYHWEEKEENMARYQINKPPNYDITLTDVPCALFWSEKDNLASFADVKRLREELRNLKSVEKVDLSHIDYLWGANVHEELYQKILSLLPRGHLL